jgi:hypothetical protein
MSDYVSNAVSESEIVANVSVPVRISPTYRSLTSICTVVVVYCLPIYFRFTVFLSNDVRYTLLYSNKYNKANFSVGFLLIVIVPTIQHTVNNQFAVRHLL